MPGRSGGRPPGPLKGETPEADALADWLRKLTGDLTLRELQERFPYGRNQWSEFRNGSKLIPKYLIADLVKALVDPPSRAMNQQQGEELLKEAEAAAVAGIVARADRPAGTAIELQLRLDDARRGQLAAEKALTGTTSLIYMLLNSVGSLTRRCSELEQELTQALASKQPTKVVEEELSNTKTVLTEVKEGLRRARDEREEAENLRLTAGQKAAEYEIALAEAARAAPAEETSLQDDDSSSRDTGEAREEPRRALWQESRLLVEVAIERLDEYEENRVTAKQRLGVTADAVPPESPNVVEGEVVRADNADNGADQETCTQSAAEEGLSGEGAEPALSGPRAAPGQARRRKVRMIERLVPVRELCQRALTRDLWRRSWQATLHVLLLSVGIVAALLADWALAAYATAFMRARRMHPNPGGAGIAMLAVFLVLLAAVTLAVAGAIVAAWLAELSEDNKISTTLTVVAALASVPVVVVSLVYPQAFGPIGNWGDSVVHWFLSVFPPPGYKALG